MSTKCYDLAMNMKRINATRVASEIYVFEAESVNRWIFMNLTPKNNNSWILHSIERMQKAI